MPIHPRPLTAAMPIHRLAILAGAVLFSTGGAGIKGSALSGIQVAGLRSGVALLAILLLMPSARSLGSLRTWCVGLAYAATMLLFVNANKLTTAANTIFLQSTAPLHILLLGPFLLREPVRCADLVHLLALAAGLALFFVGIEPPARTAPHPLLGNLLAVISGATYALTIVGLRWLGREERSGRGTPAAAAVLAGNLIVFTVSLPWAIPALGSGPRELLVVAYLGVFQIALAYTCVTAGLRHLPALEASLLLLVEPVLNPIWAFLVHAERPGAWSLAGGAIIIVSTAVKTLLSFGRGPRAASLEAR